jgi:cbb3-type cytochrome oxidase cytochrome c subunit
MTGLKPLFLGLFATFAFSWLGLALVPNMQIGHLNPQSDEEGTDVYPLPVSGLAERGRKVYTANGCFYCHTQQIRPDYDSSDIERKWGERRSAPRDYIFARPVLLGRMRMGPDLSNLGKRAPAEDQAGPVAAGSPAASPAAATGASPASASPAPKAGANTPAAPTAASPAASAANAAPNASASPAAGSAPKTASVAPTQGVPPGPSQAPSLDSAPADKGLPQYSAAWHHAHLYAPRYINRDSMMPSYRFLYQERRITGQRSADALVLTGKDAPPPGWEVVPTYEAKALVAYLMSLDQSHPLQEVKSSTPPSPPAPGKAAAK